MNAAYVRYTYYNEEGRERSDKMEEQGLLEYSQGEISYLEYMNVLQESIDLRLKRLSPQRLQPVCPDHGETLWQTVTRFVPK